MSHGPWPMRVLARGLPIGPAGAVSFAHTHFVFGFEPRGCMEPCPARLERLDLADGSVRGGKVFSPESDLVALPHEMAVVSPRRVAPDGVVSGGWVVSTFSPTRLGSSTRRRLSLGSPDHVSVAAEGTLGGDIWISVGNRLELVDPTTGAVVRAVRVPVDVIQLAVTPDRRRLYVAGLRARTHSPLILTEYDSSSGRVLSSTSRRVPAGDLPLITPTDGGVWVAPGNAAAVFLRQRGLEPVHLTGGTVPPPGRGAYQDGVTDVGRFVILTSAGGTSCVDPASGRLRARAASVSAAGTLSTTALATSGRTLFVLGLHYPRQPNGGPVPSDVGVLFSIRVPEACLG